MQSRAREANQDAISANGSSGISLSNTDLTSELTAGTCARTPFRTDGESKFASAYAARACTVPGSRRIAHSKRIRKTSVCMEPLEKIWTFDTRVNRGSNVAVQ